MTDLADSWSRLPLPSTAPVPPRYRGVWQRSLLQTADVRDETSVVRWMQLGRWHADLRIPLAARGMTAKPELPYDPLWQARLAMQQGFAGVTEVVPCEPGEVCTWHRLVDYQPPGTTPDAGHMVFDTADIVTETGVHGVYREIWHRLPGSTGRAIALAEPLRSDQAAPARLFLAGRYLMRVRPCRHAWHPDFEISFGALESGQWRIEHSTRPELEGQLLAWSLQRSGPEQATLVLGDGAPAAWRILEWED